MIEWLQSFEGIMAVSIGGINLGVISGVAVALWRNGKNMKSVNELINLVKTSVKTTEDQQVIIEEQKSMLSQKELEAEQQKRVSSMILKTVSVITAASGGIDSVSKIELVNDLKVMQEELKKTLTVNTEEVVVKVKEDVVKDVKEQAIKVLDDTVEKTAKIVNKYSKK